MALTSPGVEVTIIDQSQYLPAPTNSVPLVILATAQNKANASGTGVAAATTATNAGKLYQVTSQRDLVDLYGTPFFYTTTNGTPIQGYELNEYGLLAAYSLLGVTNRCYVLRADIDLASLVGQTGRPTGAPDDGTYWLDTTDSTWGIYEFNAATGQFALQSPIVISDSTLVDNGAPAQNVGSIGNYAVIAIQPTGTPAQTATYFYKNYLNEWVSLGSTAWTTSIPTVSGTETPGSTVLTAGNFRLNASTLYSALVTINSGDTVADVADTINGLGLNGITADGSTGALLIYSAQAYATANLATIAFSDESAPIVISQLGISSTATYYQPLVDYGTSAQMPLWSSSQTTPRPTGSVWIKVGSAGNGLNPSISAYSTATASWIAKNVPEATSDWAVNAQIDATGGQAIPAGTVYCQYDFNEPTDYFDTEQPIYFYERIATGPTIVTGTEVVTTFSNDIGDQPFYLGITASTPGSGTLNTLYNLELPNDSSPQDFVDAWLALAIPYTNALITTDGAIQLIHTVGGSIQITDSVDGNGAYTGESSGFLAQAGFIIGTTVGTKYGQGLSGQFEGVASTAITGTGTGALFNVISNYGKYSFPTGFIENGGAGYAVGDTLSVAAALIGSPGGAALQIEVMAISGGAITEAQILNPNTATVSYITQLSNWVPLTYIANEGAPSEAPLNNTNWFYSVIDQVDIMVEKGGAWIGYRQTAYDSNGHPAATGSNTTDPNGPIISASEPTTQSDGTALTYGDLWIDTSDLEVYPVINRWQSVDGINKWVLVDNTDQTSQNGVVFADARWATNGTTSPVDDPIPTIKSLLSSNYLDLDAPEPTLYPQGMLLFNTRRSGYNVKQFRVNYFSGANFPGQSLPTETSSWVTVSGNQADGSPYMGRQAQRAMVVKALRATIDTNTDIRDEDNYFNLMATPNYPELQPNMVVLNADRGETGYIIGDTPLGLADSATDIQAWATNAAGAAGTGEAGLVTRNTYLGIFYPSGIANDLSGNQVVVPASHMMLRTFLRNDTIAYPWLAAAGTRRGNIDNALNIGYLNRDTGEFQSIKTRLGIRDVLYINQINPLVFFTGVGLLNYGNKNSYNSSSALDRTNVARLINYVRRQLTLAARPFVFEPNDQLTRQQIAGVIQTLFVDLVAKRGIYDYLVVCDESNNTPARIDRNELWVDVAIEPVKAAEFIYIPVRVLNTGEIAALG